MNTMGFNIDKAHAMKVSRWFYDHRNDHSGFKFVEAPLTKEEIRDRLNADRPDLQIYEDDGNLFRAALISQLQDVCEHEFIPDYPNGGEYCVYCFKDA